MALRDNFVIQRTMSNCCKSLGGSHQSIAITFGREKLEWCGYAMVKKYLYSFDRMYECDGQMHRRTLHLMGGR